MSGLEIAEAVAAIVVLLVFIVACGLALLAVCAAALDVQEWQ